MTIDDDQKTLAGLSIDQLRAIRSDFHNPQELCDAAAQLEQSLLKQAEADSYLAFQAGTPEFVNLTTQLLAIARSVPPDPVGTVASTINKLITDISDVALRKVGIVIDDQRGKADDLPGLPAAPAPAPAAADSPFMVLNSKDLQTLAPEYADLFNHAMISADHLGEIAQDRRHPCS